MEEKKERERDFHNRLRDVGLDEGRLWTERRLRKRRMKLRTTPAVALLGLTLSTWVLSPLAAVPFFRGLLAMFLLAAVGFVVRERAVPAWARSAAFATFAAFVALHLVSLLAGAYAFAFTSSPDILALATSIAAAVSALVILRDAAGYGRLIRGVVVVSTGILFVLVGWNLFVRQTPYLTPTFLASDFAVGFSRKNQLAFMVALVFPFAWADLVYKPSWTRAAGVAVLMLAQGYTFSRMAVLAVLVGVVAPCVLSSQAWRRFVVAAASLAVLLAAGGWLTGMTPGRYLELRVEGQAGVAQPEPVAGLDDSPHETWIDWNKSRGDYIRQAWRGFQEAPVFGHGIASFNHTAVERRADGSLIRRSVTHNDFAQVLFELGAVGLATFLAMFGTAIWRVWNAGREPRVVDRALIDGHVTALVVLAVVLNVINAYTTLIFWIIMGGSLLFTTPVKPLSPERAHWTGVP